MLFNVANGCDVVGLVPVNSAVTLKIESFGIRAVNDDSFTPIEHINELKLLKRVMKLMGQDSLPETPLLIAFEIEEGKAFIALDGLILLDYMKRYEGSFKASLPTRPQLQVVS